MNYIKTPVKGMRDFLPKEMALREYVLKIMKETYENFGFEMVGTPSVEHIENLTSNQGGENEKLIFKILKRGEKLENSDKNNLDSLVDSGLRYDLTVPLARLYANNMQNLSFPFRAFQTGYSYRAERPQKGRYRELMQCDLDIIGEKTNLAEIDLITAVITFLKKLEFTDFKIKINDRRILKALINYADIPLPLIDKVLIILDKVDKIGLDKVKEELESLDINESSVTKYLAKVSNLKSDVRVFCEDLPILDEVITNLEEIITAVNNNTEAQIIFDPTLVRGMGYYTGPIFEIEALGLESAIGGGGRYDNMIGNYLKESIPACGFSVGFERLVLLLEERGFKIPNEKAKYCYLIDKDISEEAKQRILKTANQKRLENNIVKVLYKSKNFKFQKNTLENDGYQIFYE